MFVFPEDRIIPCRVEVKPSNSLHDPDSEWGNSKSKHGVVFLQGVIFDAGKAVRTHRGNHAQLICAIARNPEIYVFGVSGPAVIANRMAADSQVAYAMGI